MKGSKRKKRGQRYRENVNTLKAMYREVNSPDRNLPATFLEEFNDKLAALYALHVQFVLEDYYHIILPHLVSAIDQCCKIDVLKQYLALKALNESLGAVLNSSRRFILEKGGTIAEIELVLESSSTRYLED